MRVLHVNDVARVGSLLCAQAQRQGLDWRLYDTVKDAADAGRLAYLGRGVQWATGLARRALGADLLHIHFATVTKHTNWLRKPYVLHLHGSDIRTLVYEPAYSALIKTAIERARAVFYTTPDLREHVLPLRPDAIFTPVILELPEAVAPPSRRERTIIFPSRWDDSKGGEDLVKLVEILTSILPGWRFEGLDWGNYAPRVAALGVRLRPPMPHRDFQSWLASATCAIGQITGINGISELEVIAAGVPLIKVLNPRWYDGSHPSLSNVPVSGGVALWDPAANRCTLDPHLWHAAITDCTTDLAAAREWVWAHHQPQTMVDIIEPVYRRVIGGRTC